MARYISLIIVIDTQLWSSYLLMTVSNVSMWIVANKIKIMVIKIDNFFYKIVVNENLLLYSLFDLILACPALPNINN